MTIDSTDAVAALLDHAILHPTVTPRAVVEEIRSLGAHRLASFCVRPSDVRAAVEAASPSGIAVGTVVGFPHGTTTTHTKAEEAREAIDAGARDIDMVVHVGRVLAGDWDFVHADIQAVQDVATAGGALVKVIFETDYITDDAHKAKLCEICTQVGVAFIKTSTGFGFVKSDDGGSRYTGATEHDVKLMREHAGQKVGVKPSGGIRTLDDVLKYAELGATRIGTGSSAAILAQASERFGDAPAASTPGGSQSAGGASEY